MKINFVLSINFSIIVESFAKFSRFDLGLNQPMFSIPILFGILNKRTLYGDILLLTRIFIKFSLQVSATKWKNGFNQKLVKFLSSRFAKLVWY